MRVSPRRLTVLASLDVAGSTRLMEADERGMLAEFVLVAQAASAVFFLLVAMSFFDVLGGLALRVRTARREPIVEHIEPIPAPAVVEPAPAEPAPKAVDTMAVEPTTEHTAS